jgi:hypothetical protein
MPITVITGDNEADHRGLHSASVAHAAPHQPGLQASSPSMP